jgi:mRNA-degrading endonuclease toxin of MazEF toxin-antitoxin module
MLRVITVGQRQLAVPTLVVIPITSKPRGRHLPASVKIDPTPTNGLDQQSWLLLSSITAVDVQRVAGKLGTLSGAELGALEEGLRLLLAL